MFAYCNNNPIKYQDTGGTMCKDELSNQLFGDVGVIISFTGIIAWFEGIFHLFSASSEPNVDAPEISLEEESNSTTTEYREHTRGARKSTENKHQKGQTRKKKDDGGEKGDARRYYRGNKRKIRMMLIILTDEFLDDEPTTVDQMF